MRELLRPAALADGVPESVAADRRVRVHLAIPAEFAAGAHEYVRVQDRPGPDAGAVLNDHVRADIAAIADRRACAGYGGPPGTTLAPSVAVGCTMAVS
jgi:hypothetical protein